MGYVNYIIIYMALHLHILVQCVNEMQTILQTGCKENQFLKKNEC